MSVLLCNMINPYLYWTFSQLVSCQNEDSTGQNYDYLKILKGSGFAPLWIPKHTDDSILQVVQRGMPTITLQFDLHAGDRGVLSIWCLNHSLLNYICTLNRVYLEGN